MNFFELCRHVLWTIFIDSEPWVAHRCKFASVLRCTKHMCID